ncbi:MFS efflux transporter protein [Rutstroemia sp. NJR-2017a BVV2]|nr:MFS efflux transporter protein [Rutstroemia sp. NJR-2017a BVV2]
MKGLMTIEPLAASIPYPCPRKPEDSYQNGFPAGFGYTIEINTIATVGRVSESVNEPYVLESQPQARPENTSSQSPGEGVDRIETIWEPYNNRYRVLAACFTAFGNSMNDAANGALIGSLEKYYDLCASRILLTVCSHYHINYSTVSTVFLCNALGFLAAAFFVSLLSRTLGRAKALVISEALLIVGYTIIVTTPPFAVVAASSRYFVLGSGMSINLAIGQVFCANLANNTVITGLFQGAYGLGGTVAPLIATSIISRGYIWSRFYLTLLALAVFNLFLVAWAFWKYEAESDPTLPDTTTERRNRSNITTSPRRRRDSLKALLFHKTTVLGALFIFAYQGAEVAISGWVISFLVQFRNGDPSKVGYVTAGFWAGITLSRLTLSFLAHKLGERRYVYVATAGALILELLVWLVRSIPGDSVAVALSGVVLGPVCPAAIHIFQHLIPNDMQIASLSLIGSVGTSGGAIAPFMVGMIAQKVGTYVLHPICIGLFVGMALTWWLLPETEKKDE